jgi:hypothetical protein
MMTRKIPLYLGATALALVLGAPAFAQTVQTTFIQNNGTSETPSQINTNTAIVFAPGTLVSSVESQVASTLYNAIGPTAAVGVGSPYSIAQAAGTYATIATVGPPLTGTVVTDTVVSTSTNIIGAGNETTPAVSNVFAAGDQSASNAVNVANVIPPAGSTGTLTQVVGAATLIANNAMSATVENGTATVGFPTIADTTSQQATDSLNSASVAVTTTADMVGDSASGGALQKLSGNNSVTAVNSAIANSIASQSTIFDPTVQNINQSSLVGINQLSFASTAASTVTLDGAQDGVTEIPTATEGALTFAQGTLSAVVGNTAAAYTGPSSASYNLFSPAVTGNGNASVSGVTQNTSFGLNNVVGSIASADGVTPVTGNTSLVLTNSEDLFDGFSQTVAGAGTTIPAESLTGPTGAFGNVINGIAARSNIGSASITGVSALTTTDGVTSINSADLTQAFTNQQNSITTGGTLSGVATQTASDFTAPLGGTVDGFTFGAGYYNAAVANVNTGPASITNVSQELDQSLNSVSAGNLGYPGSLSPAISATPLTLTQTYNGVTPGEGGVPVTLGSNNVQAAVGSSSATISGAVQLLNTSINVAAAALGNNYLGTGTSGLAQTATNANLANSNQLIASSLNNSSISGAQQQAASSVNVAQLGSVLGAVTQTATNVSLTNANALVAVSGFNASLSGAQMATSQINVIR